MIGLLACIVAFLQYNANFSCSIATMFMAIQLTVAYQPYAVHVQL